MTHNGSQWLSCLPAETLRGIYNEDWHDVAYTPLQMVIMMLLKIIGSCRSFIQWGWTWCSLHLSVDGHHDTPSNPWLQSTLDITYNDSTCLVTGTLQEFYPMMVDIMFLTPLWRWSFLIRSQLWTWLTMPLLSSHGYTKRCIQWRLT